ncbi:MULTISPECIES: SDR family oxidoreductase [Methylobacterium]|jgi:NAD(P)-dependent dehydrogenase (short-subunit alcohol dehydrogenase family)|uniref:SDR family oxidoreductase n=1 Tax=Methylobacterium TaxID=407 RepID=UPI0008EF68BA|nr:MULTISPECIES: SDR family oxidoreductase [Methylobacterium]MBK3396367.1 SDR family oxidoreductase [Methylobacterium ajmalii]MBK3410361.1 SDR family oxidoreductase [Methylobacterium ajmalii]MBK3423580.1 SDR family oxidoreductase [Methylobacterium ajmalii]MBZ6411478.1 SDR family oxidoreductase [Methylobacterium sp.]SFE60891.1 NAD(P)-dependent dehydrogenase, short-chain alcohol dehydrogenase family [Methylobacterium sp. yr596]
MSSDFPNPLTKHPRPPFEAQPQGFPGLTGRMKPEPDHGETSYRGAGKLTDKAALITGGDSGIGRAVAIAYAREGADVAISYLPSEQGDAEAVAQWVEKAGRRALLLPGDLKDRAYAREIVARTAETFGRLDVVVNNGAFQQPNQDLASIDEDVFEEHFRTNVFGAFSVTKAAMAHLKPGASVIFTSSVNSKHPMPSLLAYSATKGALSNLVLSLSQLLAEKGVRVNGVLPGPIWTPFIPSGMEQDSVKSFGSQVPFGRPGQPAELASAYVMLASDESSYTSGALVTVAGAMPVL